MRSQSLTETLYILHQLEEAYKLRKYYVKIKLILTQQTMMETHHYILHAKMVIKR